MSEPEDRTYLPAPGADARLERETGIVTKLYPVSYETSRYESEDRREVHLLDYWRIIKKRKWLVLGVLLAVVTVVTIRMYRAPLIYQAVGKVIINQQAPLRLTNEQETTQYYVSDEQYLQTQLGVLRSRALAQRVIEQLTLQKQPEFAGAANARDPVLRDKLLVDQFLGGLEVDLTRNTRVVEVSYSSTNPALAAAIVNVLIEQLIDYTLTARFESTKQARDWLQKRLQELRQKLEETQAELVRYSREHQIIQLGENQTIALERLADLNRRAVEAEADRIKAGTLYQLSQTGAIDSLPPVLADPVVQRVTQQLTEYRQRLAEVHSWATPKHPEALKLQGQIEEAERQLREAKQHILANIEADYRGAVEREKNLKSALESQRAETLMQNERAIELSIKQRDAQASAQLYESLLEKLNDVQLLSTLNTTNIQPLDKAEIPTVPARPQKLFTIGLSGLVGLMLGILLAVFVEYLDNTVKSTEDVDRLLGLPALGVVPALESLDRRGRLALPKLRKGKGAAGPILILDDNQKSSFAEAFRSLRTSVLLSHAERPPRTILFTSSSPGEGKTTTSVNTAISLAQMGARVLLVDGDLRKPGLHKVFNIKGQPGLSAYLTRPIELDSVTAPSPIENMAVICSGAIPPNPSELLSSSKMRDAVKRLGEQYDFVIIDSPPVSTPDALILSTLVDGVILVIRCGETPRELVHRAKQSLEDVNAKIFGVVLNRVDVNRDGYYYYYYYRYYYTDEPPQER